MNTAPPSLPPQNPFSTQPSEPVAVNEDDPYLLKAMTQKPSWLNAVAALLKSPGSVIYELGEAQSKRIAAGLIFCLILCFLGFGLLLGTYSGGQQLWMAPVKILLGTLASAAICLPSFIIFSYLSGVECPPSRLLAILLTMLTLVGLLLLGFAPVIWVFAQSSTSESFMGTLAIVFWVIAIAFGVRLVRNVCAVLGAKNTSGVLAWGLIFLLVTFQMTAALRPIIGEGTNFLPTTKVFFLKFWGEQMDAP